MNALSTSAAYLENPSQGNTPTPAQQLLEQIAAGAFDEPVANSEASSLLGDPVGLPQLLIEAEDLGYLIPIFDNEKPVRWCSSKTAAPHISLSLDSKAATAMGYINGKPVPFTFSQTLDEDSARMRAVSISFQLGLAAVVSERQSRLIIYRSGKEYTHVDLDVGSWQPMSALSLYLSHLATADKVNEAQRHLACGQRIQGQLRGE